MLHTAAAVAVIAFAVAGPVVAQEARPPVQGGVTVELGQPRRWHEHVGLGAGIIFDQDDANLLGEARFGTYTDLGNPVLGLLGLQSELYAGARSTSFDYGLRAQIVSPYLRLGAGLDLNGLDRKPYLLLSLMHPIRRGGIIGFGSMARLNYLPGRRHSFSLGVELPFGRRINMGATRPRASAVPMSVVQARPAEYADPEPELLAAVAEMQDAALWITRLTLPFLEQEAFGHEGAKGLAIELEALKRRLRASVVAQDAAAGTGVARSAGTASTVATEEDVSFASSPWTVVDEVGRFHAAMEHAFAIASGQGAPLTADCPEIGRVVAAQAREVLLDEIILPYDRLLGQIKSPDSLAGLGVRARGVFIRWLHMKPEVPRDRIWKNLRVFTEVIDVLERVRAFQHERWDDSRFVWLPLQLAMLPEQHDTQAELDEIVERATRARFTDGNRAWYVVNEQFALHLSRTIHAAEEYHVLWVHDIQGVDESGNPDEVTYRHVLGAYLDALIERVRAYDRTATFPVYMIFLDQWFYEENRSRFWLELLQDPLRHELELPAGFEAWEDTVEAKQEELRQAVAQSHLLQDQAAQFGTSWLHNLVSVHVSITNPADASFWRRGVIPIFGTPDNVMRDHRKIAFYDISEQDPYRGGAIYTGEGVGEHYTTPSWEDRAVVVEGPALLTLKDAARDLLLNHGIEPDEIPWSLQSRPLAPDYADRIRAYADTAMLNVRALEVHNQTGYNPKDINVLKAVLYTMMPPGSVVIVPDAIWTSGFWGGLLVGNALRGGRSLLIAPSEANAPSTRMGVVTRIEEVMSQVVFASSVLDEEIRARGGVLKVGIYDPDFQATDLKAKLDGLRQNLVTHSWFRELYDFRPDVHAMFDSLSVELQGQNDRWQRTIRFEEQGPTKLHIKANFMASREAWVGLLQLPAWPAVTRAFIEKRQWQIENRDRALGHLESPVPDVIDVGQPAMDRWLASRSPQQRERLIIYLLLGSPNQNYRSMVVDGEVAFVLAGTSINAGLIDLVALTGQCDWVDRVEQLKPYYPDQSSFWRFIARRARIWM
jgi:hypothetical protein